MNGYRSIIIDPGHGGVDLGYVDKDKCEKDFNLKMGKFIYDKLRDLGFPIYMTRNDDYTLSNYDRFEYIGNIIDEIGGKGFVISIQLNNEKSDEVDIIYSVNSDDNFNRDVYNKISDITNVFTKTLPNDNTKDFYAIQRLAPSDAEVVVFEFGYNNINDTDDKICDYAKEIVDIMLDIFCENDFNSYDSYVVQKEDNLNDLANEFKSSIDDLKRINGLGTDELYIGQKLKVPKTRKNIYIVMRGDSLYSIAKKFNTTVDKIKDINNLISNKLAVNQKLLIPD